MKKYLDSQNLIDALNQRYAVKQFEKRDIDTAQLEKTVKEILQLTPTSFGLQAYKFVIVKNEETKKALREHSWGQWQVTDADMFLVLTVPTDFDASFIKKHMDKMQEVRNMDDEKKLWVENFMINKIIETGEELWITNYEEWLAKQAYIGLWNLMTSLAVLWIDSCPMEWLNPAEYNKILKLDEKNLSAKVAIAIGKRHDEDKYQHEKKSRFDLEDLFIEM